MRTCIHSSAYNPSVHTILGGPYSSTSQCESVCSSPSTTLPPITTTPNPNFTLLPPIVPFMNGSNLFNINNVPVRVFVQYAPDNLTLGSYTDLPSFIMDAKSNYNLLSLFAAANSTLLTRSQIPNWSYDPTTASIIANAGIIKARFIYVGSNASQISTYSLTSYTGVTANNPVLPIYQNADNILSPIFSGRTIYNPNYFTVTALIEYAYSLTNPVALGQERNWTNYRLPPVVIGANSFSNSITQLDYVDLITSSLGAVSIGNRLLRARFVKNDSISTSVSAYGNNYA